MAYRLKCIKFFNRQVPILCQNENGPCPLIAIANVLLLRGHITIHPDYASITLEDLIQLIANRLLSSNEQYDDIQRQQQINEVIDILPKLQYGLDVNLKFDKVDSFEFTQELSVFDAFDIALLHGWLPDIEHPDTHTAVSKLSYNTLCETVIEYQTKIEIKEKENEKERETEAETKRVSEGKTVDGNDDEKEREREKQDLSPEKKREGKILSSFLSDTASQLTYTGLVALHQMIKDNQLAVFFRNNHFCTLFRHQQKLFLLVSDLGYAEERKVVWEGLDVIDGDTEYFDANFSSASLSLSSSQAAASLSLSLEKETQDADYLLALQLQEQEGGRERETPSVPPLSSSYTPDNTLPPSLSVSPSFSVSPSLSNPPIPQSEDERERERMREREKQENEDHLQALALQEAMTKEEEEREREREKQKHNKSSGERERKREGEPKVSERQRERQREEEMRYERKQKSAEKHPLEDKKSSCTVC